MDTLGALSLATEPPADDVLTKQPYPKNDPIVNQVMWRNIFGHAIIQILILNLIIFGGPHFMGLVHPYGVLCFKYNAQNQCTSYNPYFATGLYYTQNSIDSWKKIIDNKSVTWDAAAIANFRCDAQNLNATASATKCDPTVASTLSSSFAKYTPADLHEGEET
jgi:magnesium-transporting ATPase (P-type)